MVRYEIHDDIATITMDDGKANAMNATFMTALVSALEQTRCARAVVLAGRSTFFSGGLDLKVLPGLPKSELKDTVDLFERMIRQILEYPVPVVAAVAGHALAGGAVLLLACDLAVAAPGPYKIGLNEAAIGIPLPEFVLELGKLRLKPRSWHKSMVLGQTYPAEEALALGFLDELSDHDGLLERAQELALAAARVPGEAYRRTKELLHKPVLSVPEGQLAATISRTFSEGGLSQVLAKKG